jgi:hypothetical protein
MAKRPSLADSLRRVAAGERPDILEPVPAPAPIPPSSTERTPQRTGYYAATRAGKKKVTAALEPPRHKQLKLLAAEREVTTEALLAEAIDDLFTKYARQP